ncbi:MAG: rRNA maturation RNase YbeY [Hydrotalea sp.]|nr:rRNA maturation RNase YbeY [Hydrotalea sp.]
MKTMNWFNADSKPAIRGKDAVEAWLRAEAKREKMKWQQLDYVFCSDNYLLEMNRSFLQHDYYTDIITFGLSEDKRVIEGEIYISTDRVRDNALTMHTPYKTELLRVMVHGLLHLCGYKDSSAAAKKAMRAREDEALERWFEKFV